ncbi:MarR family transcriptional regulator [Alteromonas gracilis]
MSTETDGVDRIEDQWDAEWPDLDVGPMRVVGRLSRLAALLDAELRPVFEYAGLADGEFDLLATLRRAGAPYELSAGELSRNTMVTPGAITKRVDRLVARGLVERRVADDDARGRRIRLTEVGRDLVTDVMPRHMANEERLLAGLDAAERDQLVVLLRRVLAPLEG